MICTIVGCDQEAVVNRENGYFCQKHSDAVGVGWKKLIFRIRPNLNDVPEYTGMLLVDGKMLCPVCQHDIYTNGPGLYECHNCVSRVRRND